MKDKSLIRLCLVLVILFFVDSALCQDIEPETLRPEFVELTSTVKVEWTTETQPAEVEISTTTDYGSTTEGAGEISPSSDVDGISDQDSVTDGIVEEEVTSQSSVVSDESSEETEKGTKEPEGSPRTVTTEETSSLSTNEVVLTTQSTESPSTTPETTTATVTTSAPCPPRVRCFYSLSRTRIMWAFTRICCSHCCYFSRPPYERCRPVHLRHCGYPSFQPYYHDEEDDHIDSDYY